MTPSPTISPTWTATPTSQVLTVEDRDPLVTFDGWRGLSDYEASGGTYRMSKTGGNRMRFSFDGAAITWVTLRGPDQGKARVLIDGVFKDTVDLYSPVREYNYPVSFTKLGSGRHTIVVLALGGKNDQSRDTNVVVDAFIVNGAPPTQENAIRVKQNRWTGYADTRASGNSFRLSGIKGASVRFTFNAESIKWVTARGPAYGQAQVLIDGNTKGVFDLYSPTLKWRVPIRFRHLGAGTHSIEVRVLGKKNPDSTGVDVVVDAFQGRLAHNPIPEKPAPVQAVSEDRGSDLLEWMRAAWDGLVSFLIPRRETALRDKTTGAIPSYLELVHSSA